MPISLRFDVFCHVVDNFGDIGICWRLAAQLAKRGHPVRLWLDDASALAWLAPGGCPGVEVCDWRGAKAAAPGDVVIEAFACDIDPTFIASMSMNMVTSGQFDSKTVSAPPIWINLEYLSAEGFVARNHRLSSPIFTGPGAGLSKTYFYPGFTPDTGGLLREDDLAQRQAAFNRNAWLRQIGQPEVADNERLVSLFCYEPSRLGQWLMALANGSAWLGEPQMRTRLLVCAGRASAAVQKALETIKNHQNVSQNGTWSPDSLGSLLSISYLPNLPQTDFDHLLWACDFNCVRGEDSLVRALWAGKPLAWHIYEQLDGAHRAKLNAFLSRMGVIDAQSAWHAAWNDIDTAGDLPAIDWANWQAQAKSARAQLLSQHSLVDSLLAFVAEKHSKIKGFAQI